jgi:hypothetical protein
MLGKLFGAELAKCLTKSLGSVRESTRTVTEQGSGQMFELELARCLAWCWVSCLKQDWRGTGQSA